VRRLLIFLLALSLGGCGTDGGVTPAAPVPQQSPASLKVWTVPSISAAALASPAAPALPTSAGWSVTVYYTAVQKFHHGDKVKVTGCPEPGCDDDNADLGSYPQDFVRAVKAEGSGRIATGRYLNWSFDLGYWLDTATRDSTGQPLEPFVSAAADPGELRRGTRFTIAGCGTATAGAAPSATVCAALRAAKWLVTDDFTPGLGGSREIGVYIGPETGPGFTGSDWYVTLRGATLQPS